MTPEQHPECNCDQLAALVAELARRVETQATLLHITQERMVADSLLLGTESTHLPEPGDGRTVPDAPGGHPESLTAELDPASEIYLAALCNDLWEHDEYLDITAEGGV